MDDRRGRRSPWWLIGLALTAVVAILVALKVVSPDLQAVQRANAASMDEAISGGEGELWAGLVLDVLLVAAYVALAWGAFSRFQSSSRGRHLPHPGAYAGQALVGAAAVANICENAILAIVLLRHPSHPTEDLLGPMRAAGLVTLFLLAAAAVALVLLLLARERPGYVRHDPRHRPEDADWEPREPSADGRPSRTGVCLSGGGIRSAAFSLGGLQALQDGGVMDRVEYLAATSGGGYVGAAWSQSTAREKPGAVPRPWSRGSPEERWFRDHSSYVVPGLGGGLRGLGRVLGGLLVNIVLLWLVLFALARPVGWAMAWAHPELGAIEPVALARDPTGRMSIDSEITSSGTVDVVVDGVALEAERYEMDLVPFVSDPSERSLPEEDQRANEVCFDTRPFDPSERGHCFGVEQVRPVLVEVRAGVAEVLVQPRVEAVSQRCASGLAPDGDATEECRVFQKVEVLGQPRVSLTDENVIDVETLPALLELDEQPVLRTRTGLVDRPDLAFEWWMWEVVGGLVGLAGLFGLIAITWRTAEFRHSVVRFAAIALAVTGLGCLLVLVVLPAMVVWLPSVGEEIGSTSVTGLDDYLLPSGGLLALFAATARGYLAGESGKPGARPPGRESRPRRGLFGRARSWLTRHDRQLGWYELSPLKVILGVLLLAGMAVLYVAQLQYASANGPTGDLLGIGPVRAYLPAWLWWPEWARWAAALGLLTIFAALADAHSWSLYPYYKRALSSAYLVRREGSRVEPVPYDDLLSFTPEQETGWPGLPGSDGPNHARRPKLVLCCAVNLSEYGVVPPGRRSASFTFDPEFVGGPQVGYQASGAYWEHLPPARRRDVTLASAMAISGAAFSPAMGKTNLGAMGSLLAVTNLRLGIWLPHPQMVGPGHVRRWSWIRRPGWPWFIREVTNTYRFHRRYLYVSDGGHWENLGLVELLRRGCTEVFVVSAAGDGPDSLGTIGEAMALAREELGIDWQGFDPSPVRAPTHGSADPDGRELRRKGAENMAAPFASCSFVKGSFSYPTGVVGEIVYVETTLTADIPFDVHGFAESEPVFPESSSSDQVFNHRQFEAFRTLGYHQVSSALAAPPAPR